MSEKCIPSELIKKGIKRFTCLRKKGDCCQAICINGTQCQNKGQYRVPIGKIPLMGGVVSAFTCEKLSFVPVKNGDCCKVCPVHAKRSTLFVFKYVQNKLCTFVINKLTSEMIQNSTGGMIRSMKEAEDFYGLTE